jgi:tetratricopeptide (TPR) repeat protein
MTPLLTAVLLALPAAPGPAATLLDRARTELDAGNEGRAAALAMQAVRRSGPDLTAAVALHRGAQDILLSTGKTSDLVRYYDALLRTDVRDAHRRYLRARVEPDTSKRRRDLESVLLTTPDMFWAAYDLAEAYAREGNWKRAAEHAQRAVEIRPDEKAAWNVLGHVRLEGARMLASSAERKALGQQARSALERAVALDGKFLDALYNLGLVTYVLGDERKAEETWRRAVSVSPGFAPALNSLGHLAARRGKLDEAVAFYERALAANPKYGTAHNNLAVACYRKRQLFKAQKHLALAEANGYTPVPSFRRSLTRELERAAFDEFKAKVAGARRRALKVVVARDDRAVEFTVRDYTDTLAAIMTSRFRDSHGGVSFADAGARTGGERRVGKSVVARYTAAAKMTLTLDGEAAYTLVAIAREAASTRKRALATWFADEGGRFSAHSPQLARTVAARLGLPLHDE